jgi:hypothetical protein
MEGDDHKIPKEYHPYCSFRNEFRIRRELSPKEEFVNTMKYSSMFFIGSSSHDKQHVFSLTLEEDFFEKNP